MKKMLIAISENYNGRKNVLLLMDEIELSLRPTFKKVTSGKQLPVEPQEKRKPFIFVGDNGVSYTIFTDNSAKERK